MHSDTCRAVPSTTACGPMAFPPRRFAGRHAAAPYADMRDTACPTLAGVAPAAIHWGNAMADELVETAFTALVGGIDAPIDQTGLQNHRGF
ncbi:MAG TPA: hypothetical protein VEP50_15400 [bacterium]|nr:hypothetical protein [bacterium]